MYCVTVLSVLSIVVLENGGPFLAGLMVFYLSAGFFVVIFYGKLYAAFDPDEVSEALGRPWKGCEQRLCFCHRITVTSAHTVRKPDTAGWYAAGAICFDQHCIFRLQ